MTYIIGLTGSIACGKSTVGKILIELFRKDGLLKRYIDCDELAHEIMKENNSFLINELRKLLVEENIDANVESLLNEHGYIDRIQLGKYIFEYHGLRKKWNIIVQKKIFKRILSEIWNNYSLWGIMPLTKQDVIILDMPLLFETPGVRKFMKKIICVSLTNEEVQLERLMKRNTHLTEEQARNRIKSQMPSSLKEKLSDYVILNDGGFDELEQKTKSIYSQLKQDLKL